VESSECRNDNRCDAHDHVTWERPVRETILGHCNWRIEQSRGASISVVLALQRTRAATEAMFVMMRRVFDELGRVEVRQPERGTSYVRGQVTALLAGRFWRETRPGRNVRYAAVISTYRS
jgi:hypothetical protein